MRKKEMMRMMKHMKHRRRGGLLNFIVWLIVIGFFGYFILKIAGLI